MTTTPASDWYMAGLEDDMRPRMFTASDRGQPFALITITGAEGGGPRGVGAQMVVTVDDFGGFLSGGCIEADVVLHARATLRDGEARKIVYGRGSPFVDTRLPCGGRLELLIEHIAPDDAALMAIRDAYEKRQSGVYLSNGVARRFHVGGTTDADAGRTYNPVRRLMVMGADPFALAIAELGTRQGWQVTLVRPKGPDAPPPLPVAYDRSMPGEAVAAIRPDRWTAIAVAMHDADLDHEALVAALKSEAGYVGVLGARRRLPDRLSRLAAAGVETNEVARLRSPIGLDIGARSPFEIAVSVIADIIQASR